jgi:hypothetical protein
VRLALPTVSEKGKKTHRYFSGYILGKRVIITCRHGFAAADGKYDNQRPLLVRIRLQNSKNPDYEISFQATTLQGLEDEEIILFASQDYDIVLLHCEQAPGTFTPLLFNELESPGNWEGGGYPYYNREDRDTAGLEFFSGSFEAPAAEGKHLQLNVTTTLPHMKDWREASGSPILIQGKLAGILRRYFEYDSQGKKQVIPNRLTAVYLKRLWNDPNESEFRQFIEEKLCSAPSVFREKIKALLKQNFKLQEKLLAHLKSDKEMLVDAVLNLSKQQLMDICSELNRTEKISGISELLFYAMAFLYTEETEICFKQQPIKDKPYIDVPVVRDEACEFLMASQDGRIPVFRKSLGPSGRTEVFPGKYSIISPPECGIDSTETADIIDNLLAGHGNCDMLVERIFLDWRKARGRTYNREDKKEVVIILLKEGKGTYYWLIEATPSDQSRLEKIFEDLPDIKILKRAEGPGDGVKQDMREMKLFANLEEFIED